MINKIITNKLNIKPERVRELVIEIEQQGKINLNEIQIGKKYGSQKNNN